jgi:hypothetical protein
MRAWRSSRVRVQIDGAWVAVGVKGMADISVLVKPPEGYGRSVFVEVKTGSGRQEADQKTFEHMVKSLGFEYYVARDVESTLKFLDMVASR